MKKIFVWLFFLVLIIVSVAFAVVPVSDDHKLYVKSEELQMQNIGRNLTFCLEIDEEYLKKYCIINNYETIGESFVFKKTSVEDIVNRFGISILKKDYVCRNQLFYGYSKLIEYPHDTEYNVQLCVAEDCVTVGFPIIFGEY